jgi:excisionase family DNA binding protein
MSEKLMNVNEVAALLGLAPGTVYHLVSEKRLPCVRLSRRCLRFQPSAIEEYIRRRAQTILQGQGTTP